MDLTFFALFHYFIGIYSSHFGGIGYLRSTTLVWVWLPFSVVYVSYTVKRTAEIKNIAHKNCGYSNSLTHGGIVCKLSSPRIY